MSDVPHLRFPEFSGEWESARLSSFTKKITKKNKGNVISNVLCNSANLGIIPQSEYFDRDIANTENTDTYYIIENGDFVYNPRKSVTAPYGPVNMYKGKNSGIISPLYLCFTVKDISKDFLLNWFKGNTWYRYVYSHGDTGVRYDRVSIKDDIFLNMPINIPVIGEQEKISKILNLLDERIATQNKIIEDLKLLRDAISDAMFCTPKQSAPRKRIKGFYSDWQKVHLKDICSRVSQKNTNGRCDLVLTIAAKYGLVSQLDFFNKSVASENLEGYYLLQKGDFAYNKSYSSEYTCGAVKRLERYEEGVLSPLYICFRPDPSKVNSDYLSYYFESTKWYREIMDISVEGARNHGLLNISVVDYFNTIHRIPNMDEQKCIANVIKAIMHKISSEQTILDCYIKQRIFLLRQMFI